MMVKKQGLQSPLSSDRSWGLSCTVSGCRTSPWTRHVLFLAFITQDSNLGSSQQVSLLCIMCLFFLLSHYHQPLTTKEKRCRCTEVLPVWLFKNQATSFSGINSNCWLPVWMCGHSTAVLLFPLRCSFSSPWEPVLLSRLKMRLIGDTLSSSFYFLVIPIAQIVPPGITR